MHTTALQMGCRSVKFERSTILLLSTMFLNFLSNGTGERSLTVFQMPSIVMPGARDESFPILHSSRRPKAHESSRADFCALSRA
jgi:hypothetical protein